MTRMRLGIAISGMAAIVAACAAGPSPRESSSSVPAPPASVKVEPSQEARSLAFEIQPRAGHSAQGTVTIGISGSGYTMTASVSGLAPGSRHTLNMHAGSCTSENTDPEFLVPLVTNMEADADGALVYTASHPRVYSIPETGRIFTVHGDTPAEERTHIACADLTE